MKTIIVVCARLASRRVPGKALIPIHGKPLLSHLIDRLRQTGLPIVVATPGDESIDWMPWSDENKDILRYHGFDDDPLARIWHSAKLFSADAVVRVTHDKIFVDPDEVTAAVAEFRAKKLDYLFSSSQTDGCGFEVISTAALEKAAAQFKCVEHVSYAIRAVTKNLWDMPMPGDRTLRLLCDYEEDLTLLETLMAALGPKCSKLEVEKFCRHFKWLQNLNRLPLITVYTCAHNAEEWIDECMQSVAEQHDFSRKMEYILVDDWSKDGTMFKMAKFKARHRNVKIIRNHKNLGLASSSNIALKHARGKYIIRLDADDYFSDVMSCQRLHTQIQQRELDAVYPANYFGSMNTVQQPEEQHHVGGAIFRTAALNHVRFTDGMRGLEGLDLYARAREMLRIGYYSKPTFFYTQHPKSLSKTNPEERERIKADLVEKYGAEVAGN